MPYLGKEITYIICRRSTLFADFVSKCTPGLKGESVSDIDYRANIKKPGIPGYIFFKNHNTISFAKKLFTAPD